MTKPWIWWLFGLATLFMPQSWTDLTHGEETILVFICFATAGIIWKISDVEEDRQRREGRL